MHTLGTDFMYSRVNIERLLNACKQKKTSCGTSFLLCASIKKPRTAGYLLAGFNGRLRREQR